MGFMEWEIMEGDWYEIEGPRGNESVMAALVGEFDIAAWRAAVQAGETMRCAIPSELAPYCENRELWSLEKRHGFGARLSAPGYLDCTEWSVFDTEDEARQYLEETYEVDENGDPLDDSEGAE